MILVTEAELRALLGAAGVVPVPTSPLAAMQPAGPDRGTAESLAAKGALSPSGAVTEDWRRLAVTLADPMVQANIHIEGAGTGQYFGGSGGIAGLRRIEDHYGVLAGLSIDAMLDDANSLLPWRPVSDAQPLRLDLSIEELTVLAATADAHREEQLIACIERRPLQGGAVTLEATERLVAMGLEHADLRWLVSVLNQFSAPGGDPKLEHVQTGTRSLVGRKLAVADRDVFQLGPDLRSLATGLASTGPFMAMAVHAPWAHPDVKVFARGVQYFWGIEYGAGPSERARVSRLGGRAMEALLRQYLSPFAQHAVAAATSDVCPNCGGGVAAGAAFCPTCGTRLQAGPPPRPASPPPVATVAPAPRPPASAPPPPPSKTPRPASAQPNASRPMPPPPPSQTPNRRPPPPSRVAPAPPAASVCAACGAQLKLGKSFCTACGAPVTPNAG